VGLVFAAVFLVIALYPLFSGSSVHGWALALGVAFAALAMLLPSLLKPLNFVWTGLGALLHRVTSPLALSVMFFLLITPMGIVMRWFGKDPLRLRLDQNATSYWLERDTRGPQPNTFTDQF
jgi:hypothetical protein